MRLQEALPALLIEANTVFFPGTIFNGEMVGPESSTSVRCSSGCERRKRGKAKSEYWDDKKHKQINENKIKKNRQAI